MSASWMTQVGSCGKVASVPEALLQVLTNPAYRFKRVGLEAGPLSQWLFSALAEAGLPAICIETRHMRAVLKAQINKTDRNDARMRAGLHEPVSDIDTVLVDSLKALDPKQPIREADLRPARMASAAFCLIQNENTLLF